jgi:DNA-binding NarL/FixJ family response regulator
MTGKLPYRIVLADDHPVMRQSIVAYIADYCRTQLKVVAQASDGLEALEAVTKHKPDLVFIDIQMPRMDGIQATREIKKTSPDTFVIALSQLEDHPHIVKTLDAGARDYLLKKDASMNVLVSHINSALDKKPGPYDSAIDRIHVARRYGITLDRETFLPPDQKTGVVVSAYAVQLTETELEILKMVAYRGLAVKIIAKEMKSTPATVQKHLYRTFEKLGAENQAHAVCLAIKYRLIDPDLVESNYDQNIGD